MQHRPNHRSITKATSVEEEEARRFAIEKKNFASTFKNTADELLKTMMSRRPTIDMPIDSRGDWVNAFILTADDTETKRVFALLELEPEDPFHWRVIVELFARTYAARRGRPPESTPEWIVNFALDLEEIRQKHLGGSWNISRAASALREKSPYKITFGDYNHDALRKIIRGVVDKVGPIDENIIVRLRKLYDETFWEIFLKRGGVTHADLQRWL